MRRAVLLDAIDVGLAALLTFGALIEEQRIAPAADLFALAWILLTTLPLAVRRRYPVPVALAVGLAVAVRATPPSEAHTIVPAALLAAYTLGSEVKERWSLVAALGLTALFWVGVFRDPTAALGLSLGTAVALVAVPYAIGRVLRSRSLRVTLLEHDRDRRAREAVEAERLRIARELHDVVAHSVSVMVVQAAAGERLVRRDPDRAIASLGAIQRTGRDALRDMRHLVEILRVPGEALPDRPGLAQLEELTAGVERAGVAVDVEVRGEMRELPPAIDLSAYRIVQEALTNVLKHAAAARAAVRIAYDSDALDLEITDDGRGRSEGSDGGRGLAGMRERVALYGGTFEAGPRESGGYRVRARLPLPASSA